MTRARSGPYAKWQTLLDVLTSGAPGEPVADVLSRVAESAAEIVGCRHAMITLADTAGAVHHLLPPGAGPQTSERLDPVARAGRASRDDHSRLGVPITLERRAVGGLYLGDPLERDRFTAADEQVAGLIAGAAAAIVRRTRLTEDYERRHRWLAESAALTRTLLSGDSGDPMQLVVKHALDVAEADLVAVVAEREDGRSYEVIDAAGAAAPAVHGRIIDAAHTFAAEVIADGAPRVVNGLGSSNRRSELVNASGAESAVLVPITGPGVERGMLAVFRGPSRPAFAPAEVEAATMFAAHMTLALELADSRAHRERVALLDERDRIARDLHDHVIQRLFAIGLSLQSVAPGLDGEPAKRVLAGVDDIDDTIGQIRSTIYRLTGPVLTAENSIRARLARLIEETAPLLGFRAACEIHGPVDFGLDDDVTHDCIAVLREALTNVAKHAGASRVAVSLALEPAGLRLDVADDGRGIGRSSRRSGLANLRARAERRGGSLAVTSEDAGGTRLTWSIPVNNGRPS